MMSAPSFLISPVVRFWALCLPLIFWLWLHHWGNIAPQVDNLYFSYWVTYHFEYIVKGVFPLWDPFRSWGWPNLTDPRFFGEYNPLYLVIPVLLIFQVPPFVAFNVFLCLLYIVGSLGFYLLVKCIWEDEFTALLAYTIFVVSMLGELLFSQLALPLILFSTIWFFYFFISFLKADVINEQRKSFAGLVFSIMIIVTTYLPFFFLVILVAATVAVLLSRPAIFRDIFRKVLTFVPHCPFLFAAGVAAVGLACLPGLIWWLSTANGDTVISTARNGFGEVQSGTVPLGMIERSSLAAQTSIGEIFSDQDFVMNTFCYVPVFLVILLTAGFFQRMRVNHRIIFLMAFGLFLFALAGVTPVHEFLYKHIFFVRMFRNLYLLGPFIVMLMVILATGQLRSLLGSFSQGRAGRGLYMLMIACVHAGWLTALLSQERVLWSSYATLVLSMGMFVTYGLGFFDRRGALLLAGFMLTAMLQPGQLVTEYWKVWRGGTVDTRKGEEPAFAYTRPYRGQFPAMEQGWNLVPKRKRDMSGFLNEGYFGSRYSALLYSNIAAEDLQKYVAHKFVIYSQVSYMDSDHPDWGLVSRSLKGLLPQALVAEEQAVHAAGGKAVEAPLLVSGPSDVLTVLAFDPNRVRLRTNLPARSFLVFNDSYYPGWKVYVDGKEQPLIRANIAFKGVWVNEGARRVEFKFGGLGTYALRWFLSALFLGWLSYVILIFIRRGKCFR